MTRKHSVDKTYLVTPDGSRVLLRCKVGDWEGDSSQSERAQREEHRKHRLEMGEDAQRTPLKLEQSERLRYLLALHSPSDNDREVIVSYDPETGTRSTGQQCPICFTPFPCQTRRLVDGDANVLEELWP